MAQLHFAVRQEKLLTEFWYIVVPVCHMNLIVPIRALAEILKLPVIFEQMPVQNGLKWSKMG